MEWKYCHFIIQTIGYLVIVTYLVVLVVFFVSLTTKLSMDCFKAGAMVGCKVVRTEPNGGLFKELGLTGSGSFFGGSSSITTSFGAGFSGSTGFTFECFDS